MKQILNKAGRYRHSKKFHPNSMSLPTSYFILRTCTTLSKVFHAAYFEYRNQYNIIRSTLHQDSYSLLPGARSYPAKKTIAVVLPVDLAGSASRNWLHTLLLHYNKTRLMHLFSQDPTHMHTIRMRYSNVHVNPAFL